MLAQEAPVTLVRVVQHMTAQAAQLIPDPVDRAMQGLEAPLTTVPAAPPILAQEARCRIAQAARATLVLVDPHIAAPVVSVMMAQVAPAIQDQEELVKTVPEYAEYADKIWSSSRTSTAPYREIRFYKS